MKSGRKRQQCYDDAKVEGKDSRTGKKTTISWPRDKPVEQTTVGIMASESQRP